MMNILVSQPQPTDLEKSPYGDLTKKYNVKIDFFKFIKIEGIPAKEFRQSRINLLDYSAVIFTSRNAVDHYFRMAKELRVDIPQTMKYFCISNPLHSIFRNMSNTGNGKFSTANKISRN